MIIFELSGENQKFEKRICHHKLANFPIFKDFSDEIGGDINKCDFLKLYNESTWEGSISLSESIYYK